VDNTVGWMVCECPEAQAENMGHLWVRFHAEPGCASIWYRPAYSPSPEHRNQKALPVTKRWPTQDAAG
jgi:hypothetical protein